MREVYAVKQYDGSFLLDRKVVKCNWWKEGEVPIELIRFFPDVTTAKQAGSNFAKLDYSEDLSGKRRYSIVKIRLSMEEVETVFTK